MSALALPIIIVRNTSTLITYYLTRKCIPHVSLLICTFSKRRFRRCRVAATRCIYNYCIFYYYSIGICIIGHFVRLPREYSDRVLFPRSPFCSLTSGLHAAKRKKKSPINVLATKRHRRMHNCGPNFGQQRTSQPNHGAYVIFIDDERDD